MLLYIIMDFSHSTEPISSMTERVIQDVSNTKESDISSILHDFVNTLTNRTQHHLGYPYNLDFDYSELKSLTRFSINNLGDPFIESNYGVHSRPFEIAVLDWFAQLWEIQKDDYWGYITSCGTEGNLHGIYVGRENLPNGILYASEDSHYSVFKAARMYRMPCERISSNADGTISIASLKERLQSNKGTPAILNVNIGTTLKGGVDDLDAIIATLYECGYTTDDFYIHCDGALVGMMIGFLEANYISFASKPIGSVSVSGHKFIGSPIPCGIIITRIKHIQALSQTIDYINSRDATIMGSRNGHAPLYMWYTLVKKGLGGIGEDVHKCIENAEYLRDQLSLATDKVLLNKWSNTVVFPLPKDPVIVKKWQLACSGDVCHIVVMPNIEKSQINMFVEEYMQCGSRS